MYSNKYQEIIKKFLPKIKHYLTYRTVIDNFIGITPRYKPVWGDKYTVDMSQEFCKYTQYKPLPLDDGNLKAMLAQNPNDNIIYSCMDGHLHSSGNCGIPQEISVCGYPTNNGSCGYLVGGLQHYLVPGCHIVYHKLEEYSVLYYGEIGTFNYAIYKKMYEQANKAVENYNKEAEENKKYMANEPFLFPENPYIDIKPLRTDTLVARPSRVNEAPSRESSCFACMSKFEQNDRNIYILPCSHFIHLECLASVRGVKEQDVTDNTEANKDSIRGVIKDGDNELLIDTSHRICPLEHNPPGPYPFLFGRTRSYKKNRKINTKSLKKIRKYSIKKMKFGETSLGLKKISYPIVNKPNTKTEELTESNKPNINKFLNTLYDTISQKKSNKESITNELTRLNEIYKFLSKEFFKKNKNKFILTYVVERSQTDHKDKDHKDKVDLTKWWENIEQQKKQKQQKQQKKQQKNIRLRKNEKNTKS
jgi:hypothetical protein